jgi:magnesium-transporting ATPase (P-type)
MTLSNLMTLYIVYLSFLNKNVDLREKIIYLFNSLKESKFSFLKIKLLLKFIVIFLKKWVLHKLKYIKDNLFSILLTLILIISVANVFRQPIFIFLGKDIFDNFYLYIYIMFSSILPTTYIIIILSKRFKTSR